MHPHRRIAHTVRLRSRLSRTLGLAALAATALAVSLAVSAPPAFAGHASLGEALFYPCTSCHPVTLGADGKPAKALPNGFKGHEIQLESHDKLGAGAQACLACHDDAARDPGKLKLIDGSLVDVTGDVSQVCYRCHEQKYKDFKAGTHGKHAAKCTSSGCHDPHTPAWIYASPLRPFAGTGFQARAVSDRKPFTPLASSPVAPPVETPSWLVIAATLGMTLSAGLAGTLIVGRSKR